MENSAAPSTTSSAEASAGSTDLVWNGRTVAPRHVAGIYFLGSSLLLLFGVLLNYTLTDGEWYSLAKSVNSPLGEGPTYLTGSAYDVATLAILVASLVLLGAGFLAAYRPSASGRGFQFLALLAAAFLGYAGLLHYGLASRGDPLLILTLGVIFGLVTLAWAVAARVGATPRMHYLRAAGFVLFGFYWATQLMRLYVVEEGDFVNATFSGAAVFLFNYFAYHELLSIRRREDPRALQWLAGAAFITTGVYVATHKLQVVSEWLILRVSEQTTWLLQFFNQNVERGGGDPEGSLIMYPVADPFPIQIILACTAIQSIMIFVGGIMALRPPRQGDGLSGRGANFQRLRPTFGTRRTFALLLTVPLIYALNLFRNVIIISMSGTGHPWFFANSPGATAFICQFDAGATCGAADAAFWFSHNIIGKGGSLLALIILAFMVFQILPELYDSIVGLLDLKQRRGPLERWLGRYVGRRGNGGTPAPDARAPATSAGHRPPAPAEAKT